MFSIGTDTFQSLHVTKFKYFVEVLDGDGTGRTKAPGWPMIRDPNGVIKNIEIEISMGQSDNPEFISLLKRLESFGAKDFETVTFLTPSGSITQEMYSSSHSMEMNLADRRNVTHWGVLRIKFIAKKGIA